MILVFDVTYKIKWMNVDVFFLLLSLSDAELMNVIKKRMNTTTKLPFITFFYIPIHSRRLKKIKLIEIGSWKPKKNVLGMTVHKNMLFSHSIEESIFFFSYLENKMGLFRFYCMKNVEFNYSIAVSIYEMGFFSVVMRCKCCITSCWLKFFFDWKEVSLMKSCVLRWNWGEAVKCDVWLWWQISVWELGNDSPIRFFIFWIFNEKVRIQLIMSLRQKIFF